MALVPIVVALVAVVFPVLYWALGRWRQSIFYTQTALSDLPSLGATRATPKVQGTAVVCGGSIAGLLTARVLSDHFTRVLIIERDACTFTAAYGAGSGPSTTDDCAYGINDDVDDTGSKYKALSHAREHVAQYPALHLYPALLTRVLRALFPGFDEAARGAGLRIAPGDVALHIGGAPLALPASSSVLNDVENGVIFGSRRALETLLRQLVSAAPGVEFLEGTVTAYNMEEALGFGKGPMRTVGFLDKASRQEREAVTIFVADCTGEAQEGIELIRRALAATQPTPIIMPDVLKDEFDPKTRYGTLDFASLSGALEEKVSVLLPQSTQHKPWLYSLVAGQDGKTVQLTRREGGSFVLGFGGPDSEKLPVTVSTIASYVKNAGAPQWVSDVLALLDSSHVKHTVHLSHNTRASRVLFERVANHLPCNLVAIGDAHTQLPNSDGLAITALGVLTLDGALRRGPHDSKTFGSSFFTLLAARSKPFYEAAKRADGSLWRGATTDATKAEAAWLADQALAPRPDALSVFGRS